MGTFFATVQLISQGHDNYGFTHCFVFCMDIYVSSVDKNLEHWPHILHGTLLCDWIRLLKQGDVCGPRNNNGSHWVESKD